MHLAQFNIGRLVADQDSEVVGEFMRALDAINLLGESSPGFVWLLKDDAGPGSTAVRVPGHENDDRTVLNLTVWEDFDSFRHFVTRSGHGMYLRRRREWFEPSTEPTTVLWWIPEGQTPDVADAAKRLEKLRADGPSPEAFSMTERFDPDGRPVS